MISELTTTVDKSFRKGLTEQPCVVSLFTGGGGLDLGLEAAGFQTLFATDIDAHSIITLQRGKERARQLKQHAYRDCLMFNSDITSLKSEFILDVISKKKGEVDLLAGGPPCQAFSVFGRRAGRNDPRGQLVYQYFRLLSEIKPKAFVFENVYGLETVEGGEVFKEVIKHLAEPSKNLKYKLSVLRLNAADYGVPQFRDRIFIIGTRNGSKLDRIEPLTCEPSKLGTNGCKYRWRTVADALRNLPPIGHENLANHTGRRHSDRIIQRYGNMGPGERDHFTRINKLDLDRPSYTIIVGSDNGGGKGHIHPVEPREVTPRESARIQTFPDWWEFSGKVRHPIRQIGNAVPPLLGAAVGNAINREVFGSQEIELKEIINRLSQEHLFPEFYGRQIQYHSC